MRKILLLGAILLLIPLSNVCAEQCRADANCDGSVNLGDLVIMKGEFMSSGCDLCFPPTAVFKTGQTSCYDELGNVIDCAGTGQDGEYQRGYQRYTDNGDGTVTDTSTEFIWLKDANCIATHYPSYDQDDVAGDGGVTWQHALDFIKGINDGTYPLCAAGYADWRLPNEYELISNMTNVLCINYFLNATIGDNWWSSSTNLLLTDKALVGNWIDDCIGDGVPKSSFPCKVLPVRGGQ